MEVVVLALVAMHKAMFGSRENLKGIKIGENGNRVKSHILHLTTLQHYFSIQSLWRTCFLHIVIHCTVK